MGLPPAGLAVTGPGPDLALVPPTPTSDAYRYVPRFSRHRRLQVLIHFVDWLCYIHLSKRSLPPLRRPNHPLYSRSTCVRQKDKTSNHKSHSIFTSVMRRAQIFLNRKKSVELLSIGSARDGGSKLTKSPPPVKRSTMSWGEVTLPVMSCLPLQSDTALKACTDYRIGGT